MFTSRGDAHKVYLKLKRTSNGNQSFEQMKELKELNEIKGLYQTIDSDTLKLIFYRMIKEKNGSGIIPILVSSIPWFFFLFSTQVQEFLFRDGVLLWIIFCVLYFVILISSVVLHFRENAWAAIHIEIIQDILKERSTD